MTRRAPKAPHGLAVLSVLVCVLLGGSSPDTATNGPAKSAGSPAPETDNASPQPDHLLPLGERLTLAPKRLKAVGRALASRNAAVVLPASGDRAGQFVTVEGRELGLVEVTLRDEQGETEVVRVKIVPGLAYLTEAVRQRFPQARVVLQQAGDGQVYVAGTVEANEEVGPLLELLEGFLGKGRVLNGLRVVGVMQVQLEVCIARVTRAGLRRLGFNWLQADEANFYGSTVGTLIGNPAIRIRGAPMTFNPGRLPDGVMDPASSLFFFGLTDATAEFYGFVEALRNESTAKVLATPTLVTHSGRAADFLVGGEYPVPVPAALGQPPSVNFKPFGTRLVFLPVVLGNGRVRLDVQPEVSRVNPSAGLRGAGFDVPQFDTQRLHTIVEMQAGQTLALGGLLQSVSTSTLDKVPWLGDVPYLGGLFRRVRYMEEETELLVLVTPRLFDPLHCSQVPGLLPGEETRRPDDFELFLKGLGEVPLACATGHKGKEKAHHHTLAEVNSQAREAVRASFEAQAGNGQALDATLWNHYFMAGTDRLDLAGLAALDRLARRSARETGPRPADGSPPLMVFLQTSWDLVKLYTPDNPSLFVAARADLDARRVQAVARYLAAAWPTVLAKVEVNDPEMPGMSARENGAVSELQRTSRGVLSDQDRFGTQAGSVGGVAPPPVPGVGNGSTGAVPPP